MRPYRTRVVLGRLEDGRPTLDVRDLGDCLVSVVQRTGGFHDLGRSIETRHLRVLIRPARGRRTSVYVGTGAFEHRRAAVPQPDGGEFVHHVTRLALPCLAETMGGTWCVMDDRIGREWPELVAHGLTSPR